MELTRESVSAVEKLIGSTSFTVPAEKTLTLETTPNGEEILSETVPVGKSWSVRIDIRIIETDA